MNLLSNELDHATSQAHPGDMGDASTEERKSVQPRLGPCEPRSSAQMTMDNTDPSSKCLETCTSSGNKRSLPAGSNENLTTQVTREGILVPVDKFPRSSFSSTTGSFLEPNISIDLPSSKVYRFKGQLYVGKIREVPLPANVQTKWSKDLLPRLLTDLQSIYDANPPVQSNRILIEPQLCMSGFAVKGSSSVTLTPCIWIRCGSKRYKEHVEKTIKNLSWLKAFGAGDIEVHIRAPRFTASESREWVHGLSFHHGYGRPDKSVLHLHVERPTNPQSACGLLCVATITSFGHVLQQRISRIGGLVHVNESDLAGVSTAHGMFEDLFDSPSDCDDSDSDSDSDDVSDSDAASSLHSFRSSGELLGAVSLDDPIFWQIVRLNSRNFLGGHKGSFNGLSVGPAPKDTDFALLNSSTWDLSSIQNEYTSKNAAPQVIDTYLSDKDLEEGPVRIIFRPENVVEGYLLPMASMFLIRNIIFETRKIELTGPLAEGTSGAWVVRQGALCGMIVAGYHSEPYAHMVTAEKLFRDIKQSDHSITTVNVASSNTRSDQDEKLKLSHLPGNLGIGRSAQQTKKNSTRGHRPASAREELTYRPRPSADTSSHDPVPQPSWENLRIPGKERPSIPISDDQVISTASRILKLQPTGQSPRNVDKSTDQDDDPRVDSNPSPSSDALPMHQTSSQLLRKTDTDRLFMQDYNDIFATLSVSLSQETAPDYIFTSERAISTLDSLHLTRRIRTPDPANPSRIITTTTTTVFSMSKSMARALCQRLLDTRCIEAVGDTSAESEWFPLEGGQFQLTPKGMDILQRFCRRNGIASDAVLEVLSSPRNTMHLITLERDTSTDRLFYNSATVDVIFRRFAGQHGPNIKYTASSADSDSWDDYADGVVGVKFAARRKIGDKVFPYTFTGRSAVNWLMSCCTAIDWDETYEIAEWFVTRGLIVSVLEDTAYKQQHPEAAIFQPTAQAIYTVTERGEQVCGWVGREKPRAARGDLNKARLHHILQDPALRLLFREFLSSSLCEENLSFYLEVSDFVAECRLARADGIAQTLANSYGLYNLFLAPGSPSELNIEHDLRNNIVRVMSRIVGDEAGLQQVVALFEQAQRSVFNLMSNDSVPKFVRNPKFAAALREYDFD